jgi:hypothetical protein
VVLLSVSRPPLTGGVRYWIKVVADSNNSIAWNLNSTGDGTSQTISADGGASWLSSSGLTAGAFEVDDNQPFVYEGQALSANGSNSSINVAFPPGFAWTATSGASWLTLSGSASGTGSRTLNYQVAANTGPARSTTITVAGSSFTVEQAAGSIAGLSFIGSMAHLAAEENWTTTFTLVNKSSTPATARLSLFGDPAGTLTLPLVFPQILAQPLPELAASLDRTIAANGSVIVTTAGPQAPPVLVGSAQLAATGAVDGFAIFHQIPTAQEAVVPMETRSASSYLLPFENAYGNVLGVAVENLSGLTATIPVIIRASSGIVMSAPGATISLDGNGHTSFVLSGSFLGLPVPLSGTIEFDTPAGGRISVLGIRFAAPNNALTTIPALANIGTGGGSIAHLASGGDGWETTFLLVNVGSSTAEATLSFFSDLTGAPLSLPLTDLGLGTYTLAPSVTETLAAGATLMLASAGAPQLLTGSAQITSAGNVSGFVIFRHNNQEAVVPLESRNAQAYIIPFDNTHGTATGVAVNAVSPPGQIQQVNISVTVRNDAGAALTAGTITLAPNGHYAFTLGVDKFQNIPNIGNIRGTIEFDTPQTPAGIAIGALGIRIPAGATTTYTTLPAIARQ